MKKIYLLVFLIFYLLSCYISPAKKIHYSVNKIWGNGSYCAFTSLIKYKGTYYCTFREGESHIFDKQGKAEGKIRILASKDGNKWSSVFFEGEAGLDFRDPKLSITPDGRLMVNIGCSIYQDRKLTAQLPYVIFSNDGKQFTTPHIVSLDIPKGQTNNWLWRTTWQGDTGYAVNYCHLADGKSGLQLMTTKDGKHYKILTSLNIPDFPNESTIRFLPSGKMTMIVRRDGGDCVGYWGISSPPYTEWTWKKMNFRLGGPDFLVLNEDKIILGSRSYYISNHCKMALYKGNVQGDFQEVCILPSGGHSGDSSYPGLLIEGNELWVSYYTSLESDKTSIYLAKLPLTLFK